MACSGGISTIGRRGVRRSLRPKFIIVCEAGAPAPEKAVLFCTGHCMMDRFLAEDGHDGVRCVDIYRGQAASLASHPGMVRAQDILPRPVLAEEVAAYRRRFPQAGRLGDDQVQGLVRRMRGDLDQIPYLLDSPWTFSAAEAAEAATLDLHVEHRCAGVRFEHGRWTYYRGRGAVIISEGAADTREEAIIMARACLWRAWLERVEWIMRRRGGVLDWGLPLLPPQDGLAEDLLKRAG